MWYCSAPGHARVHGKFNRIDFRPQRQLELQLRRQRCRIPDVTCVKIRHHPQHPLLLLNLHLRRRHLLHVGIHLHRRAGVRIPRRHNRQLPLLPRPQRHFGRNLRRPSRQRDRHRIRSRLQSGNRELPLPSTVAVCPVVSWSFAAVTTTPAIGAPCMSSTVPTMLEVPAPPAFSPAHSAASGASGNSFDDAVTPKSKGAATTTINKHPAEHKPRKIFLQVLSL